MKRGTDVKNLTAMFLELSKRSAANIERAFQIDVDNRTKAVWRQVLSATQKVAGGSVDNDINLAKLRNCFCKSLLHLIRFPDIGNYSDRLASLLVDRLRRRPQMLKLATN